MHFDLIAVLALAAALDPQAYAVTLYRTQGGFLRVEVSSWSSWPVCLSVPCPAFLADVLP